MIDRETRDIERVVAVHDVGRAVNPMLCEGQIEGAVHMGLGYALTEDFPSDPATGFPTNITLRQLGILRPKDVPPIDVDARRVAAAEQPVRHQGRRRDRPRADRRGAVGRRRSTTASTAQWRDRRCRCARDRRRRLRPMAHGHAGAGLRAPPPVLRARPGHAGPAGAAASTSCRSSSRCGGVSTPPSTSTCWRSSAPLGALEALECGTTAIVDHHESPNAIEGSLVGDRRGLRRGRRQVVRATASPTAHDGRRAATRHGGMTDGARRGLAENERFLRAGGRGLVGVHAAFTCTDETLEAAAGLAADLGVGVHIHVAEGVVDADAGGRGSQPLAADDWLIVHCVHLDRDLPGTIAHNPRCNMNNAVGYAAPGRPRPTRSCSAPTGSVPTCSRSSASPTPPTAPTTSTASPDAAWSWLEKG